MGTLIEFSLSVFPATFKIPGNGKRRNRKHLPGAFSVSSNQIILHFFIKESIFRFKLVMRRIEYLLCAADKENASGV